MHCINAMPKALRPGKDRGATILLGAKAPIVEGALLASVLVPFIKLEPPYEELKDLLGADLGVLGRARQEPRARGRIDPARGPGQLPRSHRGRARCPEMVAHPRENPFIFYEEYFEEDGEEEEAEEK